MFAFIPGLGGVELLLLGVLCVLPMIAGAVVLIVVLANQKKKKHRDDEDE